MTYSCELMAKNVAEKALDEFLYDGKSIREWMKIIAEQELCEDCISREDALSDKGLSEFRYYEDYAKMRNYLKSLPSVQPKALGQEPKTVIYSGDGYADGYIVYDIAECPNCGYEYEDGDKDWGENFCPHCGQPLKWESEVKK